VQVRLTYREPRIIEREPDGPDSLIEREPKFAMIASPAADDCKPLQLQHYHHLVGQAPAPVAAPAETMPEPTPEPRRKPRPQSPPAATEPAPIPATLAVTETPAVATFDPEAVHLHDTEARAGFLAEVALLRGGPVEMAEIEADAALADPLAPVEMAEENPTETDAAPADPARQIPIGHVLAGRIG
jgi:hypothetical protein